MFADIFVKYTSPTEKLTRLGADHFSHEKVLLFFGSVVHCCLILAVDLYSGSGRCGTHGSRLHKRGQKIQIGGKIPLFSDLKSAFDLLNTGNQEFK